MTFVDKPKTRLTVSTGKQLIKIKMNKDKDTPFLERSPYHEDIGILMTILEQIRKSRELFRTTYRREPNAVLLPSETITRVEEMAERLGNSEKIDRSNRHNKIYNMTIVEAEVVAPQAALM